MRFRIKILLRLWVTPLLALYAFALIISLFNAINPPPSGTPVADLITELMANQMMLYAIILAASLMFGADIDTGVLGYTLLSPIPRWLYALAKWALILICTAPATMMAELALHPTSKMVLVSLHIHIFTVTTGVFIASIIPWKSVAALTSIAAAGTSITILHGVQGGILAKWVASFSLLAPIIGNITTPVIFILSFGIVTCIREELRQMRP